MNCWNRRRLPHFRRNLPSSILDPSFCPLTSCAAHDWIAVDDYFADEGEQLGGPILTLGVLKKLGRLVDKARGETPLQELWMGDQLDEKRDIGFDAANAELLQAAFHVPGGVHKPKSGSRHFDEQGIVKRRDDRAGEGRAGVQPNPQAAR